MNLNKVILAGRLIRDPELNSLPNGLAVSSFVLATERHFTDKSGEKQRRSEFHNIVFFGRTAEIAHQYLKKGSIALIEGRIQTRSWENAEGVTRYKTEIVGEILQLGPKREAPQEEPIKEEEIPIIQEDDEEIDIKDIPF